MADNSDRWNNLKIILFSFCRSTIISLTRTIVRNVIIRPFCKFWRIVSLYYLFPFKCFSWCVPLTRNGVCPSSEFNSLFSQEIRPIRLLTHFHFKYFRLVDFSIWAIHLQFKTHLSEKVYCKHSLLLFI